MITRSFFARHKRSLSREIVPLLACRHNVFRAVCPFAALYSVAANELWAAVVGPHPDGPQIHALGKRCRAAPIELLDHTYFPASSNCGQEVEHFARVIRKLQILGPSGFV
jgi:hypothetical protein